MTQSQGVLVQNGADRPTNLSLPGHFRNSFVQLGPRLHAQIVAVQLTVVR